MNPKTYQKLERLDLYEQLTHTTFARMPRALLQRLGEVEPRLNPLDRLILIALFTGINEKYGTCAFPSVDTLKKWTGAGQRSVEKSLARLTRFNLVKVQKQGRGRSYDLSPLLEKLAALPEKKTEELDDLEDDQPVPAPQELADLEDRPSGPPQGPDTQGGAAGGLPAPLPGPTTSSPPAPQREPRSPAPTDFEAVVRARDADEAKYIADHAAWESDMGVRHEAYEECYRLSQKQSLTPEEQKRLATARAIIQAPAPAEPVRPSHLIARKAA